MSKDNKKEEVKFEFEGKDYFIKALAGKHITNGRKVYTKAFKKAVEDGAILKKSLDDHMRKQGLWDDDKQDEYTDLIKKSADLEYKIKSGHFKKASELRDKALELKEIRAKTTSLMASRNSMDAITAEGLADNEQFNYFVTASVYDYLTQKPVFSSLEDYENRAESGLAGECAQKFASYFYDLEEDFESSFLENKLLKKLKLLDDKGFLVNADGKRVDEEGNLLDEDGARIDLEGNRIDINDNPILEDNVIDNLEFIDDLKRTEDKPQEKKRKTTTKGSKGKKAEEPAI
jgi:hypothetical protein|tara:strand:+ start:1272 stop:2138 length:867 start_codon:yes stop_codon:yes gene_type:complete